MPETPEGMEDVEYNPYGETLQPYRDTGRYIILKGKYRGSFIDTVPVGYLEKIVLAKWDMTEKERRITAELLPRL